MIGERHRPHADAIVAAALTADGACDPSVRRAAFSRAAELGGLDTGMPDRLPPELLPFVDMVSRHAYRTTDDDVAAVIAAGWSEDAVFELIVATAAGAGLARLDLGLVAIREASG